LFHAAPPAVNDSGDEFCTDSQRNLENGRGKYAECMGLRGSRTFLPPPKDPGGISPLGAFLWGSLGLSGEIAGVPDSGASLSEGPMQAIMARWCDLIGVTNEGSIQVAIGVVSGGAALFVAYAAFVIAGTVLGYIGGVIRDFSS
jgi:hypothetical protein